MKVAFFFSFLIFPVLVLCAHNEERLASLYQVHQEDHGVVITEVGDVEDLRCFLEVVKGLQGRYQRNIRIIFSRNGHESELGCLGDVVQDTMTFVEWEMSHQRELA